MKNNFLILATILFTNIGAYSQSPEVETIIDSYIVYVQDINTNEVFLPKTIKKNLPINNKNIEHDITYYSLDNNQLFSIIIQSYAKPEVKATYYFKNNNLIMVFIEENNFASNYNNKKYRNYFLKDNQIIHEENTNNTDDYQFFIQLGKVLGENYLKNISK